MRLYYSAVYILIVSSGLYLAGITSFSPVYGLLGLGVMVAMFAILLYKKIYLDGSILVSVAYLVYLFFSQLLLTNFSSVMFLPLFSLFIYPIAVSMMNGLSKNHIIKLAVRFIRATLALCIVEAYYRLSNPTFITENGFDHRVDGNLLFYAYKENSIMFTDSNFVGVLLLTLFFFVIYISKITPKKNFKYEKILLFILILLTFSRAAILVSAFFYVIQVFYYRKNGKLLIFVFGLLSLLSMSYFFSSDGSLSTKYDMFNYFIDFYKIADITQIMFGVGFGESENIHDISQHVFLFFMAEESGLLGILFLFILWSIILFKTNGAALIVMAPFLMVGMSSSMHSITFLYACFAIIYSIEKRAV